MPAQKLDKKSLVRLMFAVHRPFQHRWCRHGKSGMAGLHLHQRVRKREHWMLQKERACAKTSLADQGQKQYYRASVRATDRI